MKSKGYSQLTDIMAELKDRCEQRPYFLRINAYSIQVEQLLRQVFERAKTCGCIIDGKLVTPDVRQITYYQEMLGDNFELDLSFIERALTKWMQRLPQNLVKTLAHALFEMLSNLKKLGKNDNILKNAFIKYMCWLFYKFSQAASKLSADPPPMILYSGEISIYELQMLTILNTAGCDVILLQTKGDQAYLKLDQEQRLSKELIVPGGTAFPDDYGIKSILDALNAIEKQKRQQIQSSKPQNISSRTQEQTALKTPARSTSNAPMHGTANPLSQVSNRPAANASVQSRIHQNQSPAGQTQISASNHLNRNVSNGQRNIVRNPPNTPVRNIAHPNPSSPKPAQPVGPKPLEFGPQPLLKLNTNQWAALGNPLKDILTPFPVRSGDHSEICNAFYRLCGAPNPAAYENDLYQFYQKMLDSGRHPVIVENGLPIPGPEDIAKIRRGNYRFAEDMIRDLMINFSLGIPQEIAKYAVRAFASVMMEASKTEGMNLNKLTANAVYLICWFRKWQHDLFNAWKAPAVPCFIYFGIGNKDKDILFLRMLARMPVDVLMIHPDLNEISTINDPLLKTEMSLDTVRLDEFPKTARIIHVTTDACQAQSDLDQLVDTGMYRSQQLTRAKIIPLHTAIDEINLIWHQEILARPNADVNQGTVSIPVLFSKISGVEQEKEDDYWLYVKQFITPETYLLPKVNFANLAPIAQCVRDFVRNGKIQKDRLLTHRYYNYNLLRSDMQEHMLNCLQTMLDSKLIRNPQNQDSLIIASALSLNRDICRYIQQFDFTRKTPKVIILHTAESLGNIHDAIQLAFMSMIGFDILIFAPTGYQCIEQWYNFPIVDEHQAGSYHYNYRVPNFNTIGEKQSWFSRLLRS